MRLWTRTSPFSAAAAMLIVIANPAASQAQTTSYRFGIPAEDLGTALRTFGQVSGQQIIFSEGDVHGRFSTGLSGAYTADDALKKLIAGTSLVARRTRSGVIVLAKETAPPAATPIESEISEVVVTGSRIRRTNPASATPTQAVVGEDLTEHGYVQAGQMLDQLTSNQPTLVVPPGGGFPVVSAGHESPNLFGLGAGRTLTLINGRRMVTTGSGLHDRSVDANVVPVGLLDRVDIVEGGGSAVYGSEAIAGVVNYVLKSHYTGVELEAQYGGSTRGDDARPYLRGTFGTDFDSGRGNIALNVDWSKISSLAYEDRPWAAAALTTIPNPANASTTDGLPPTLYVVGGHIWTYNTNGVIFKPFTGLSPTASALLRNTAGTALQFSGDGSSVIAYDPGVIATGSKAVGGQGTSYADLSSLTAGLERVSLYGIGHYELTPHLKISGELLYSHEDTDDAKGTQGVVYSAGGGYGAVSFTNANPFLSASEIATLAAAYPAFAAGSPLLLSKTLQILPNRSRTEEVNTWRGVLALDGDFSRWSRSFYYSAAFSLAGSAITDKLYDQYVAHLANALDAVKNSAGQAVCRINLVTVTDAACVPINPFAGYAQQDPRALAYATLVSGGDSTNRQGDLLLTFGGDVVRAPGGTVRFSTAYEHRFESARFSPFYVDQMGFSSTPARPELGRYSTNEYSGEVLVPVFGPGLNLPLVTALDFTGSYRRVENSLAGKEDVWAAGVRWDIAFGLGFRASKSRNFRAPTLDAQFAPVSTAITTPGADPCDASYITSGPSPATRLKNCQALFAANPGYGPLASFHDDYTNISATTVTAGGNPNLKNEIANSLTWGLTYQPGYIPGLTLSADRTEVEIDNAFTDVNPQTATALCYDTGDAQACSSFTRNAQGFINTAHDQTENAGYLIYRGEIYTANYRFPISRFVPGTEHWGTLEIGGEATHTTRFGGKATPLSSEVDYQGVYSSSFFSGIFYEPKWRGRFDLRYTNGPFKAFYSLSYLPDVKSSPTATIENSPLPVIKANITQDASVQYYWRRMVFTVGVNNLTDEGPSFPTLGYGDVFGRRFFLSCRLKL